MIALALGTALALGALAFVLAPLVVESPRVARTPRGRADRDLADSLTEEAMAVEALREIEFDRATGKLSDADYRTLKATYTQQAIVAMRASAERSGEAAAAVKAFLAPDAAEAAILAYRSGRCECPSCGPRPEREAIYCSDCGRYLAGVCASCGATADQPSARYCSACGGVLAA